MVGVLTFLLLARAFRSVLLPVKALILNALSIGAAYGATVLIWQDGHLTELLFNTKPTGAITTWVPIAVFAFVFGLSMDYEVFILTRAVLVSAAVLALSGRLFGPALGAALVAAVVLGTAFVVVESRASAPLIDRAAIRTRSMSAAVGVTFVSGTTFLAIWFQLSLTLQNTEGRSPIVTGALFLPFGAGMIGSSILSPRLMARLPSRTVVLLATAISTAGFAWLSGMWDTGYATGLLPGGLLVVVGVGLLFAPLTTVAASDLPDGNEGTISGLLNCSRQVGGSVGLAALSLVAFTGSDAPHVTWSYLLATGLAAVTVLAALRLPRPPLVAALDPA